MIGKIKGKEELVKIMIELEKWNKKYNGKTKDKRFVLSTHKGSWFGNNELTSESNGIDFVITKEEFEELKRQRGE